MGKQRGANVIRSRKAKGVWFPSGIEDVWNDEPLHVGQELVQLIQEFPPPKSQFEAVRRADQEIVLKHQPRTLQRSTDSRLAEMQLLCGRSDALLLCNDCKGDKKIEVYLSECLQPHITHKHTAQPPMHPAPSALYRVLLRFGAKSKSHCRENRNGCSGL